MSKKHYHVEAFDDRGFDLLPPRTILIIEEEAGVTKEQAAEREVAKLVTSKVSYLVITEMENV